jgi:hypothetical protein
MGFELKHLVERLSKMTGDLEGQFEAWEIFGVLDRHDGLSGHANSISQILLSHFIGIKAQAADLIGDVGFGQVQKPRR